MTTFKTSVLLAALLAAGCANDTPAVSGPFAIARLQPTVGSSVNGEVRFTQVGDRVRVTGEIHGLAPNSEHGFHIHEKGDCSSPDAMSAGGHFNPVASAHGAHATQPAHAGDLPSLRADASGTAPVYFESRQVVIGRTGADILGRALIVHRDADDFHTQPTGNAGPRAACAVITKSI